MYDAEFIDKRLLFYGFKDFFINKVKIRTLFMLKNNKDQYLYKWYVYSRPFINDTIKNYIWDYLQRDIQDIEFSKVYSDYMARSPKEYD